MTTPLPINVETRDWSLEADKGREAHQQWHDRLHRNPTTWERGLGMIYNYAGGTGYDATSIGAPIEASGTRGGDSIDTMLTSAATIGSGAGEALMGLPLGAARKPQIDGIVGLGVTTNVRWFFGFALVTTDTNLDQPFSGAYNQAQYAGIQFSTVRGDTAFQFISADNASQVISSSGVAVDTALHHCYVYMDGANVTIGIDGASVTRPFTASSNRSNQAHGAFAQAAAAVSIKRRLVRVTWDLRP